MSEVSGNMKVAMNDGQSDCLHEVVDEDGGCLLCSASIPMSLMYSEYTHVVESDNEACTCDGEPAYVFRLDEQRGVEIVECNWCGAELSHKVVL